MLKKKTSAGSADEPQIVELGHVILDGGAAVAQFGGPVLVVTSPQRHQRPVVDVAEADDAEGRRQRLVGAPVTRQRCTEHRGAGRGHQIGRKTQTGDIVRVERRVRRRVSW